MAKKNNKKLNIKIQENYHLKELTKIYILF